MDKLPNQSVHPARTFPGEIPRPQAASWTTLSGSYSSCRFRSELSISRMRCPPCVHMDISTASRGSDSIGGWHSRSGNREGDSQPRCRERKRHRGDEGHLRLKI